MNQKNWDKWKEQPDTKAFFKFLGDYREQMGRDVALEVSSGSYMKKESIDRVTTHCGIYSDIEEMEFVDFENFYTEEAKSLSIKEEIEK